MTEQSNFPVVIRQEPINVDDEPTNRLIIGPEDLPTGVGFVVIATQVQVQ